MLRKLKINGITWIDGYDLTPEEIEKLLKKYKVHELDLEACLEGNQKSRIDNYDKYSFITYHFPKYNNYSKIYDLNEFNIFLSKDFLITIRSFKINNIDRLFDYYSNLKIVKKDEEIKFTSGYILYEITQAMLEKMFKVIKKVTYDIKAIEKQVFEKIDHNLVKDIMIKKRNIVVLKHMFKPQVIVLKKIEETINKIYAGEMEVYFEDLEDKLEQIVNDINIIWEHIDTVEDAFKSIIDIKTNSVLTFLAIFSAFLLPLTLITSFYGMNIKLPYSDNNILIYSFLLLTLILFYIIYLYLKKNGRL